MSEPAISARGLTKGFGSRVVLMGLDLEIYPGSVYGLVGLNGAGKTTLVRLLLGLLKPDGGTISIAGQAPRARTSSFFRGLGVVLEHDGFAGNLTVGRNLSFFARAKGLGESDLAAYVDRHWAGTAPAQPERKTRLLSRGQRMQCAICRAFLGRPRVCLLDEPVVALDMAAYDHFCGMVREARNRGAAILISSHQLDTVEELCDCAGLLEDGALTPVTIPARQAARRVWLLTAPGDRGYGDIIAAHAVGTPKHSDGVWEFAIDRAPEEAIPALLAQLIPSGCPVVEVRPKRETFRDAMRVHLGRTRGLSNGEAP